MMALPPSFLGTVIATVLSTIWVIVDEHHFHLWTTFARFLVMGGAFLVLTAYSVALFLEEQTGTKVGRVQSGYPDYLFRLLAQTLLALALASIGINLGVYIGLFAAFIVLNFFWTNRKIRSFREIKLPVVINVVLCGLYTWSALGLYAKASDFENSYASMIVDKTMYDVRITSLRGESTDDQMLLALVVAAVVVNLVYMVSHEFLEKSKQAKRTP